MTEKKLEQVSAFMDGELEGLAVKPTVDKIIGDSDARQCWQRYHLIGDVMRNTLPGRSTSSIASRVSQALKNEPTILSPEPINTDQTPESKAHRHPVGYAVAASVAVIGFLTVGLVSKQVDQADVPEMTASTVSVGGRDATVATASLLPASAQRPATPVAVAVSDNDSAVVVAEDVSPKLQEWVLNHEFSSLSASRHGVPPNVRLVTFSGGAQQGAR